ncbi:hypothetical protein RRG08_012403 [Elysia crispata]|uniref:Uncharacterized protein n=1 Tax=Elysia crispata TaxID=231223 RepID=A0AAE0YJY6_9GAST|nr:hypothetical protein RRG08_012403 [Elysia crispata]
MLASRALYRLSYDLTPPPGWSRLFEVMYGTKPRVPTLNGRVWFRLRLGLQQIWVTERFLEPVNESLVIRNSFEICDLWGRGHRARPWLIVIFNVDNPRSKIC